AGEVGGQQYAAHRQDDAEDEGHHGPLLHQVLAQFALGDQADGGRGAVSAPIFAGRGGRGGCALRTGVRRGAHDCTTSWYSSVRGMLTGPKERTGPTVRARSRMVWSISAGASSASVRTVRPRSSPAADSTPGMSAAQSAGAPGTSTEIRFGPRDRSSSTVPSASI